MEGIYTDRYAKRYQRVDQRILEYPSSKLIIEALKRGLRGKPGLVLDIGCGTGRWWPFLPEVKALIGTDQSAAMLKLARRVARKNFTLVEKRFDQLKFPESEFDLVFSIGLFGHNLSFGVDEARQIFGWLRKRGQLVFNVDDAEKIYYPKSVPRKLLEKTVPPLRLWLGKIIGPHHLSAGDLIRVLKSAGFKTVRLRKFKDAGIPQILVVAERN